MTTTITDPWTVSVDQFPRGGSPDEIGKFLLNYAVLAPSSHNSQPWRFQVRGKEIRLFADRTRALPVTDPDDRELIMGCGAALMHLTIALRAFGFQPTVQTFPDIQDPDLLALVRVGQGGLPSDFWMTLLRASKRRRTNRGAFEKKAIPTPHINALTSEARAEGVHATIFDSAAHKAALAELIADADMMQVADKGFRREMALWLHPARSDTHDGMPAYAKGLRDWMTNAGPTIVRTFDSGRGEPATNGYLAKGSPILLVLSTATDNLADWLSTGQALARLLLRATDLGLMASFLNQPVQVPELRPAVSELVGQSVCPQLVLRLGYGSAVRPTPRRPVHHVMVRR